MRGALFEFDEAVVLLEVAFEQLGTRAEHSLEALAVEAHALEGRERRHRRSARPVQDQSDLTCSIHV